MPIVQSMPAAAPEDVHWLAIDRSVRMHVGRSVRSGAPAGHPGDAAVAAGYCAAVLDWLAQKDRLRPFELAVAVALLADLLFTWTAPLVPLLGALLGFGFLRLRTPALSHRLSTARYANVAVAAGAGAAPVRVRLPGESWLRPGPRRRRLVKGLEAALALLAFTALIVTYLPRGGEWAVRADAICAREHARLSQLRGRELDPSEALQRRIDIERATRSSRSAGSNRGEGKARSRRS